MNLTSQNTTLRGLADDQSGGTVMGILPLMIWWTINFSMFHNNLFHFSLCASQVTLENCYIVSHSRCD